MTANNEIKARAKQKGVCLWEVADKLGLVDSSFSRKLRRELPPDEKRRIINLIDEIATEKQSVSS
ncbi:MAG: hypothetical protein K6F88_03100 [Ruminococcus sp.]|nr:hypothetical protein [Ruminococcus sp.]